MLKGVFVKRKVAILGFLFRYLYFNKKKQEYNKTHISLLKCKSRGTRFQFLQEKMTEMESTAKLWNVDLEGNAL